MSKTFKWSLLAISIIILYAASFSYYFASKRPKQEYSNTDTQATVPLDRLPEASQNTDAAFDDKMAMATQAILENEQAEKEKAKSPPVYAPIGIQQTKDFLKRLDKALADNSSINLDYLPDVAAHSRVFNDMNDEAESIYGKAGLDNPHNQCISAAITARLIWDEFYSPSRSLSEEYKKHMQQKNKEYYAIEKKECLESVS